MQTSLRLASLSLALAISCLCARGNEPIAPDKEKEKPDAAADAVADAVGKKGAAPELVVSDEAKPVLDKIKAAYAKTPGLQMSGTWSAEWDIEGDAGKEVAAFTSTYAAPNRFRHEVKDDLLFGSTGERMYAFKQNQFLAADAPKARVGVVDLPATYASLLKEKNPSLLLAVTAADSPDETPFLAEKATKIDKAADVTIDGRAFTSLKVQTSQDAAVSVLVDPDTGFIRQWTIDLKPALEKRGQQNVKLGIMRIDYNATKAEAPAAADAFAWAPPPGAKDASRMSVGLDDEEALKLVGKTAPDFNLEDLEGKRIRLSEVNKDHVVVLDLWAKWCAPCREALLSLDKVTEARKDKKLKVFAINLEDDKDTVRAFVKETKLNLPMLLDPAGETGRAYLVNGLPQTVVVGKDGVVKHVLIGIKKPAELEKAIDDALKE